MGLLSAFLAKFQVQILWYLIVLVRVMKVIACAFGAYARVELQWLEHLWDYANLFEIGVVRAIEGLL